VKSGSASTRHNRSRISLRSIRATCSSALNTVGRCKLIEQIRRFVISTPTKPLTPMKTGMFDASQTFRPLEMGPTTTFHMHAYNDCSTMRTGMTIGLSSSLASFRTQFPSRVNEGRTT
jgi:hypothetical protein